MGNLTLLEEEVLRMLKQIEYCVESAKLLDSKTFKENKFIEIYYIDKDRPALEVELTSMSHIETYLQKNAIDFRLTYNFIDHPERPDGFIMLGRIYAKNLEDIEEKIQELIDKLNSKNTVRKIQLKKGQSITQLDLLEDLNEIKRVTVYVNVEYRNPRSYARKGSWGKMYELAKEQRTSFEKSFFDYFNSNSNNPLYAKKEFKVTKILKQEDKIIIPNIKISLITQKKVTQRLNSA